MKTPMQWFLGCLLFLTSGSAFAISRPQNLGFELPEIYWKVAYVVNNIKGGRAACSGTFIAKDMVLTAGHCVFDPKDVTLALVQGINVVAFRRHPLAGRDQQGRRVDLAVVLMDHEYDMAKPAQLADEMPQTNQELIVTGAGSTPKRKYDGDYAFARTKFDFFMADDGSSNPKIGFDSTICQGDSGGGSFIGTGDQIRLVGVNVNTMGGTCGEFSYDTAESVYHHRKWIEGAMAELRQMANDMKAIRAKVPLAP